MSGYTVVEVAKGALIHECERCGAVVLHRPGHDVWHERIVEAISAATLAGAVDLGAVEAEALRAASRVVVADVLAPEGGR